MITDDFLNQKTQQKLSHDAIFYRVFTYIYPLLIEKDICDRQSVSVKLPCVYVCLSSKYLFILLIRVSLFLCYPYFSIVLSTWSQYMFYF
jgi:hypothetical protein